MNHQSPDAGIPVLTEIIPAPRIAPAEPKSPIPEARLDPVSPPMPHPGPAFDQDAWERMERELAEKVLVQILGRVDTVLEQRVRDSLADALQTAVDGLASEIRQGLERSLKETVARAVAQEIAALQDKKK